MQNSCIHKDNLRPSRVVIVENNKLERVNLRYSLSAFAHIKVIGEADCAKSVVKLTKTKKPDIVLMNSDKSTIETMQTIKAIRKDAPNTKNIMLTDKTSECSVLGTLNAGANAYCVKSNIGPKELSDVIKIVAKGGCWIDPLVSEFAFKLFTKPENIPIFHIDKPLEEQIDLTPREFEVLKLLVQGKSNTKIAKELFISDNTVKNHVAKIFYKFKVNDRVKVVAKAIREKLV